MRRFRDLSLKWKLMLIMSLVSVTALVPASLVFLSYELYMFRRDTVNAVTTLSEVIAANSMAALDFNDPDAAAKTLATLATQPGVLAAGIWTATDGKTA